MPKVETTHPSYDERVTQWERAQDCYDGSDAVKKKGPLYLPHLDSHSASGGQQRYDAYKQRALYFNATARTVDGLAGSIFQKEPEVTGVSEDVERALEDVTMEGKSLEQFAHDGTKGVLLKGRFVVLVDFNPGAKRPHMAAYEARDLINWESERVDGDPRLSMAMLRESETYVDDKEKDPYAKKQRVIQRELYMDGSVYKQRVWEKLNEDSAEFTFRKGSEITPSKNGKPLNFIPLVVIGPSGVDLEPCKPPMLDLVDVNLSHYRTSADLEHGRHFVALPTPWISGAIPGPDGTVQLGPAGTLILDKGGQAGMLEFSGAGLGALVTADEDKRKMMASLGSRMLESGGTANETAFSVAMRHSGEHATLRTVAGSVEEAFEQLVRIFVWWTPAETTVETPEELTEVEFELNKDFFSLKMTAADLSAWVAALQSNAISYETFWYALMVGDVARPGVDWETEKKAIDEAKQEDMASMQANGLSPDGKPLPDTDPASPSYVPGDLARPGVNVPGRPTKASGPKQGPQGASPKKPGAQPEGQA
jgi:hypothetical protein